jgi:hypothetical protein
MLLGFLQSYAVPYALFSFSGGRFAVIEAEATALAGTAIERYETSRDTVISEVSALNKRIGLAAVEEFAGASFSHGPCSLCVASDISKSTIAMKRSETAGLHVPCRNAGHRAADVDQYFEARIATCARCCRRGIERGNP